MKSQNTRNGVWPTLSVGLIIAILLVVAAFSFAHGNSEGLWRCGYGSGYEEGWQAAYIHFAEGGE